MSGQRLTTPSGRVLVMTGARVTDAKGRPLTRLPRLSAEQVARVAAVLRAARRRNHSDPDGDRAPTPEEVGTDPISRLLLPTERNAHAVGEGDQARGARRNPATTPPGSETP